MKSPLSKEEFLEKLKTDREFNSRYGRKHTTEGKMVLPPCHYGFQVYTRELSDEERAKLMDKLYGIKKPEDRILPWLRKDIDEANIPTRAISLMFNMRSCDVPLGLPFNLSSYGLLLEIIAKIVNMVPEELIANLGDTHIYSNQIDGAREQLGRDYTPEERNDLLKERMGEENYNNAIKELMPFGGGMSEYYNDYKIPKRTREPYKLPALKIMKTDEFWKGFDVSLFNHLDTNDFIIENYISHPSIKIPLSN